MVLFDRKCSLLDLVNEEFLKNRRFPITISTRALAPSDEAAPLMVAVVVWEACEGVTVTVSRTKSTRSKRSLCF